jgi:hypothetical protein
MKIDIIIECPKCKRNTFVGIAQGHTSDDRPYPIGECSCCDMNLKTLDSGKDLELMMEFRNVHWGGWVNFCIERGYEAVIIE